MPSDSTIEETAVSFIGDMEVKRSSSVNDIRLTA
jgi:hypothetical protein